MDQSRSRIVVAPDSFKGTRSATEIAAAMAAGVRDALGSAVTVIECPLADGGEGTLDALAASLDAEVIEVRTLDAIGRPRRARVAKSSDGKIGIIEAAEANGLPHVCDVDLQPMRADSYGVGLLARYLLDDGVSEILLCIGGSASNDGGTGFLSALGARFLDAENNEVALGAAGLADIDSVDLSALHPRVAEVTIVVALDVDNPLLGPEGAAAVFGPQKGAGAEEVAAIDAGIEHLAAILHAETGTDVTAIPGAGAAGGLPACLVPLLGAVLMPGSDMVMRAIGFADLCSDAVLVLTGEGSFDSQSLRGKVVAGVRRATPADCPVVVIAGRVALSPQQTREAGISAALSIAPGPARFDELSISTTELVRNTAAHVASMYAAFAGVPTTSATQIAS
ncbi:glycerate kinase [Rhodococcus sp. 14-2483-1-2]|uniref:glycerate kinase n=1 Tax=Rhodococcus sp. 14-2483-1-2 TaxID=2023147 RepID=UPI000B9A2F7B|nr:glycerate kinase [Rhodococcus sp. 14-2483-1-2]OZF26096.1 glycerate kinase [Rhodococcus sp. 14-2483-1-2]